MEILKRQKTYFDDKIKQRLIHKNQHKAKQEEGESRLEGLPGG